MSVGLLVLSAHLIADFPLQPDWMAQEKTEDTVTLLAHVSVHTAVLSVFLVALTTLTFREVFAVVALLSALHALIDHRRWVDPKESWDNPIMWVWLNDQIMHITAIAIVINIAL